MRSKIRRVIALIAASERKRLRRIADHTIVIADKNGDPIVGPLTLETLLIVWKYGGYGGHECDYCTDGMELWDGARLYLYPPEVKS